MIQFELCLFGPHLYGITSNVICQRYTDTRIYLETFARTDAQHCQIVKTRKDLAVMQLCDVRNKGFHTFRL